MFFTMEKVLTEVVSSEPPRSYVKGHIGVEVYGGKQGIEIYNSKWMLQMTQSNGAIRASLFVKGAAQDLSSTDERVMDAKYTLEAMCTQGLPCEVPQYWADEIMKIIKPAKSQKPEHA